MIHTSEDKGLRKEDQIRLKELSDLKEASRDEVINAISDYEDFYYRKSEILKSLKLTRAILDTELRALISTITTEGYVIDE